MVQKAGKIFLFTAFCLYSKLKSIIIIHVLRNYQIFKYFTNIKILNIHKGFFRTPKILPSNKQRSNTAESFDENITYRGCDYQNL